MLELVGELSALSGSAIARRPGEPGRPARRRGPGHPRGARRVHVSAWRARRRPPDARSRSPARRRAAWSRCPARSASSGAALADPSTSSRRSRRRPPLGHQPARPRDRLRDPGRRRAVGRPAARCAETDDPLAEPERELIRVATTAVGNIIRAAVVGDRRRPPAPAGRRPAARHQRHRQPPRPRRDPRPARRPRAGPVLGGPRRGLPVRGGRARRMAASRGLSQSWITAVTTVEGTTLGGAAITARRPMFSVHYRDDPRVGNLRAAVIQEGFDTALPRAAARRRPAGAARASSACTTTSPTPGRTDELDTMAALATQATVAIKAAARTTPSSRRGPPSSSRSSSSGPAPEPPDQRQGDRRRDRDRAAPAHRLPQRPRLPPRTARTSCRWRCRAGSASTSTRRRSS